MAVLQKIIIVAVALAILNFLLGGVVFQRIGEMTGGGQGALDLGLCYVSANMWNPTATIYGLTIPIPSVDDVTLALGLTMLVLWVMEKTRKHKATFKEKATTAFLVWLTIRVTAAALVISIPGCGNYAALGDAIMDPIQGAMAIIAIFIIIKWMLKHEN